MNNAARSAVAFLLRNVPNTVPWGNPKVQRPVLVADWTRMP